jgi:hypothetical protein
VQVSVPTADIEEILPAGRLLSRATAVAPVDYERAKSQFLEKLDSLRLTATDLTRQLEAAAARDGSTPEVPTPEESSLYSFRCDSTHFRLNIMSNKLQPKNRQVTNNDFKYLL